MSARLLAALGPAALVELTSVIVILAGRRVRVWCCQDHPMIIEHALLQVTAGRDIEFEAAFGQAKAIISSMPGFRGLSLSRCLERGSGYLLLVRWDTLEDHTEGFRGSVQYDRWRALLHEFYDPFPTVEHFEPLVTVRSE